jgi:biotin transport system substrate-specific component
VKALPLAQDAHRPLSRSRVQPLLAALGFALATALAALTSVPLPFSPVPVTLQTLVVTLAGAALGPVWGPVSQILYVGAGLCGLPVFAYGTAGPGVLLGPTGGYLVGFVVAAWIAGLLVRPGVSWMRLVPGLLAAHAAVFLCGVSHLAIYTRNDLAGALALGLIPFLPGTVLKTVVAALCLRSPRFLGWLRPGS